MNGVLLTLGGVGALGLSMALGRHGSRATDPTSTPAFQPWFNKSQVVNAKGEPLVVYHGTTAAPFDTFALRSTPRKEQIGFGIHFTENRSLAERYAHDDNVRRRLGKAGVPRVVEAYLSIQNPFDATGWVEHGSEGWRFLHGLLGKKLRPTYVQDGVYFYQVNGALDQVPPLKAMEAIRASGHDGVRYTVSLGQPVYGGIRRIAEAPGWIAFEPSQVRIVESVVPTGSRNPTAFGPYTLTVTRPGGSRIHVEARHEGVLIGVVDAEPFNVNVLQVQSASVAPAHRRRGLASAMYDAIEAETGMVLIHGDIRATPETIHLWRKRLGKSKSWALDLHADWLMDANPDWSEAKTLEQARHVLFGRNEKRREGSSSRPASTPPITRNRSTRTPTTYIEAPSDLFRESGVNATDEEIVAEYARHMAFGWDRFPPIVGQMTVIDTDDLKAYRKAEKAGHAHELAWSRPLTRADLGREVVVIQDGHHRAHAAAYNGIPIRVRPFCMMSFATGGGGGAWSPTEIAAWWAAR